VKGALDAAELADSVVGGCTLLSPGGASRSNSKFAATNDRKFVLKVVKSDEMSQLGSMKLPLTTRKRSLILPMSVVDKRKCLIAMPHLERAIRSIDQNITEVQKFDVKPEPAISVERAGLFQHLIHYGWWPGDARSTRCQRSSKGSNIFCWQRMQDALKADIEILKLRSLTDYSLVFTFALVNRSSLDGNQKLPWNCIVSHYAGFGEQAGALCVNVIDYLMYKSPFRTLESLVKKLKWHWYGDRTRNLFNCVGFLARSEKCQVYVDQGLATLPGMQSCTVDENWRCSRSEHGCIRDVTCKDVLDSDGRTCNTKLGNWNLVGKSGQSGGRYVSSWEACCCTKYS
jgi:hypothetical protein